MTLPAGNVPTPEGTILHGPGLDPRRPVRDIWEPKNTAGDPLMTRQCESLTLERTRCRREGTAYHRHIDHFEYCVCPEHNGEGFRMNPRLSPRVKGAPAKAGPGIRPRP
jgi:hypothetical protein